MGQFATQDKALNSLPAPRWSMTQTSLPRNLHIKGDKPGGGGEEGDGAPLLPLLPSKETGPGAISDGCGAPHLRKEMTFQPHLPVQGPLQDSSLSGLPS